MVANEMEKEVKKYKKHKQGYSVSITYYLRKDNDSLSFLKKNAPSEETSLYPLYIRVAFLGQTVKLRSRLDVKLSEEQLEQYMAEPHIADFIEKESASIRYSIEELQPDTIDNFRNSQWSSFYNDGCTGIIECIQDVATDRLRKLISKKVDLSKESSIVLHSITLHLKQLELLSLIGVKPAASITKEFNPAINAIQLLNNTRFDQSRGPEYVIWDWKLGHLQSSINSRFPNEASSLLKFLESIIKEYVLIEYPDISEM